MKSVRIVVGLAVGLLAAAFGAVQFLPDSVEPIVLTVWAVGKKAGGQAPNCDWEAVTGFYGDYREFVTRIMAHRDQLRIERYDKDADIVLLSHPTRDYWFPHQKNVEELGFAYTLAENDFLADRDPDKAVKPGDIVVDCGAHVGVFTAKALSLGAAKVIAVEPQSRNLECLRRNFPSEIKDGRLVLVPKAVWSSEGTMNLNFNAFNPAASSLVKPGDGGQIEVQLTTIDLLVAELRLSRVDFIKLDIEDAEREALKGAKDTIRKHHPRFLFRDCLLDTGKCAVIRFIAWTYETGFSGESNGKLYRSCRPCSGAHSRKRRCGRMRSSKLEAIWIS